jgi:hypothetical protein
MKTKTAVSKRDQQYLDRLRAADEACYQLWRQTEINSPLFHAVSKFQTEELHPEIKRLDSSLHSK